MSRNLVLCITNFLNNLEQMLLRSHPPGPALALAGMPSSHVEPRNNGIASTLEKLMDDSILWAVPKHRRTVEKRLNRKFGYPEYFWKPLKVKANLRSCNQCGHDHEVGVLCPHCYNKVRTETQEMQDKIQAKLGLNPIENEVIVLYEGEKTQEPKAFFEGKRIVEMEKPRPIWFTKNLLQKSTQPPANTAEVKPSDLG